MRRIGICALVLLSVLVTIPVLAGDGRHEGEARLGGMVTWLGGVVDWLIGEMGAKDESHGLDYSETDEDRGPAIEPGGLSNSEGDTGPSFEPNG